MATRRFLGGPLWAALLAAALAAAVSLWVLAQSADTARAAGEEGSGARIALERGIDPAFLRVAEDDEGALEPRIVGGTAVPNGKYPFMSYMVIETDSGSYTCGGSLIDRDSVLTAAHCLEGATRVTVVVGRTVRSGSEGQIRFATEGFSHPRYDGWRNSSYDTAVLNLNRAVKGIQPIPLATAKQDGLEKPGRMLTTAGWGDTKTGGNGTDRMREVSVPVVSDARAKDVYSSLLPIYAYAPSLMVAAGEKGKDSCQGDSGGPLFSPGGPTQVGIVSYGYKCATAKYPGVYTEVNNTEIRRFILSYTRN